METPKKEIAPEAPESFLVEFNAARAMEITSAMSDLGFGFRRGIPDTESGAKVTFEGERRNGDGTKITIIIEKGKKYKSPKELEETEEK